MTDNLARIFWVAIRLGSTGVGWAADLENRNNGREIRVKLMPAGEPISATVSDEPATLAQSVTVLENRSVAGPLARQRSLELSSEQIVVVGLDDNGNELSRVTVMDPRFIRAEAPDASGRLTHRIIYLESAELVVVFPEHPDLASIRLYHPRWTGADYVLELIGGSTLP